MTFSEFAAIATAQDQRNKFAQYEGNLDIVPDALKPFYCNYNPVDVEIEINCGDWRFYPAEELPELQREYAYLNAQFVFATCNSDPIFYDHGQVYTCPHGVHSPVWEPVDDPQLSAFISSGN